MFVLHQFPHREARMRHSMAESFETPDGSILQVCVGVALILLGVLLTGIAVLRVTSL